MKDERKTKKQLIEELKELRDEQDPFSILLRRAVERVRAEAVSMRYSDDLLRLVAVLYREMRDLDMGLEWCNIYFVDRAASTMTVYVGAPSDATGTMSWTSSDMVEYDDGVVAHRERPRDLSEWHHLARFEAGEPWLDTVLRSREFWEEWAGRFGIERLTPEFLRAVVGEYPQICVPFEHGVVALRQQEMYEDYVDGVRAFADGLSLGFVRFLDTQRLEQQNRQLEVEQILERVRGQALGMHQSEDLTAVAATVFGELRDLGIAVRRCGFGICNDSVNPPEVEMWATTAEGDAVRTGGTYTMDADAPSWMKEIYTAWEQGEEHYSYDWRGDELEAAVGHLTDERGLSFPDLEQPDQESLPQSLWCSYHFFTHGYLAVHALEPLPEENLSVLEQLTAIFGVAYSRFLDLQAAETRARQAELDIGVERVRSASMAMASSDDLPEVVATLFREMKRVGVDARVAGVIFVHEESGRTDGWNVFPSFRHLGLRWGSRDIMDVDEETVCHHFQGDITQPTWPAVIEAWRRQEVTTVELTDSVDDLRRSLAELGLEGPQEAIEALIEEVAGTDQVVHVPFAYGMITHRSRVPGEDLVAVVRALAGALELGYLRYFDLQAAEERAAQSAREAAYERVRSAVLAARSTDDILTVNSLMFRELCELGVRPTGCSINLIDEEAGEWRQLSLTAVILPLDEQPVAGVVAHWRRSETYMRPAEWPPSTLQEARESGGEEAVRWYQSIKVIVDVPFTYGTLGMNSAVVEEFSQEEIDILKGFADVISLAYTRYLDFQKVEEQNKALTEANQEIQAANERIQQDTRNKSEFLSRMSHDLRTPMNAIIGYTRILTRRLKGVIEERQYGNLENIQTSASNLLNLINEILDLSRIEAGRIDLKPEAVDLGELVGECITSVAPLVKPEVVLTQELGDVRAISTDADRIRRVIMNLLGNAVKFTEEGKITVSLKPVDEGCELAVADTGVGIPAEDLPHIFKDFHQVERQVGEKVEGTGLGLAIAAMSVQMLGGTISAESELGKGTTFTVRIGDYAGPTT